MTLWCSENHVTVLSDHQDRTNIFCLSEEFVILAWIQRSGNFAFPGVQQCKLVFVFLATYKYVKHCCSSHWSSKDRARLATKHESMFAKSLRFLFLCSRCCILWFIPIALSQLPYNLLFDSILHLFQKGKTIMEIFVFVSTHCPLLFAQVFSNI